MESVTMLSHGTGLVSVAAVAVAMALAGLMFLVFRMSPGPDYKEVFRKQREQLMAMDEPKHKKKEKPAKKNKDKAKDKKDRAATPTQVSVGASSSVSAPSEAPVEEKVTASSQAVTSSAAPATPGAKNQVHQHNHHDHVDFADKEDVKLVELDQPPKVEADKVLSANRQPGKPILVHHDALPVDSTTVSSTAPGGVPAFVRSNSFKDLKPMDEVELHHKKQQSPSKASTGSKHSSKDAKEQKDAVKEEKAVHQVASPNKKQQQAKEQSSGAAAKKANAVNQAAAAQAAAPTAASTSNSNKKSSPQHESGSRKERKIFTKKELRELINQIDQHELPPDTGEDTIQHLVDSLLNHQNESKEWRSTRQDPMQVLKKTLQEREDQVSHLTDQLNSTVARNKEIHNEMALWKTRCGQTQAVLTATETRFRDETTRLNAEAQRALRLENQLRETQAVIEQLRAHTSALESMNHELKTSIRRREEVAAVEKQTLVQAAAAEVEKACAESVQQARAKQEEMRVELEQVRGVLEQLRKSSADQLESEKRQWEGRVKVAEAEVAKLQQTLRDSQTTLEQAKKDIAAARGAQEASSGDKERLSQDFAALKDEVEQLKARNQQLHEKSWATVEAMNQAEQKYRDLHAEQMKQRKMLVDGLPKEAQTAIKDVEGKDFAKLFVAQLNLIGQQLKQANADAETLRQKTSDLEVELKRVTEASRAAVAAAKEEAESRASAAVNTSELEEEVDNLREEAVRLRAENAHYSGVLSKTEKILQDLQDSVEREEKRWAEDRGRFEAERAEMSSVVRELESKLKELQLQLEFADTEKNAVQSQLDSCRVDLDKANQQLAASLRAAESAKAAPATVTQTTQTTPASSAVPAKTATGNDVTAVVSGVNANSTAPQKLNGQCSQSQLNGSEDSSPSPTPSAGSGQANGSGGHDGEGDGDVVNEEKKRKTNNKKKKAKKVR